MLMVFHWSLMNLVVSCLGRTIFVLQVDASLGDIGVHSRGDGLRVRFLQVADDESVSWRERRAHAHEFLSPGGRFSVRRNLSAPIENSSRHIAGDTELTMDRGGQGGQFVFLFWRRFAPARCASFTSLTQRRRFKLYCTVLSVHST